MARRRPRGIVYTSRRIRKIPKFQLLVEEGKPTPRLSLGELVQIAKLAYPAWRLYLARERRKNAEKVEKAMKATILEILPVGDVQGFISRAGRAVRVLVALVMGRRVTDVQRCLDYLGDHASDVVKGALVSPEIILSAEQYPRFHALMQREFGEDFTQPYDLVIDTGALDKKVEDGDLPEPPADLFEYQEAHRRVLVSPV